MSFDALQAKEFIPMESGNPDNENFDYQMNNDSQNFNYQGYQGQNDNFDRDQGFDNQQF